MNAIAEQYVKLVLAVGQHDPAYVDAYYGPPEWKAEAETGKRPLTDIDADAARLIEELGTIVVPANTPEQDDRETELSNLRHVYLRRQLEALRSRVRMLSGTKLSFDEESQALYDAVAPTHPESYFQGTLDELERRLPGTGPLIDRVRRVPKAVRDPARPARARCSSWRSPSAGAGRCRTSSCRRRRASRSST